MSVEPTPARPEWLPGAGRRFIHIAVAWAFAVAQPIFSVLSGEPAFFVSRGSEGIDIVALALFLILAGPLAAAAIEAAAGLIGPRALARTHLAILGALGGVFALQVLDGAGAPAAVALALSLPAGALFALLYARQEFGRTLLTVLAPAPLLFAGLFAFTEPLSALVRPDQVRAADVEVRSRAPVVVLIFDELPLASLLRPDGSLDAERWPGFAEVAGASRWHRRATSVAAYTPHAVPAILAGRNPPAGTPPIAAELPVNLFTLLARSHRMHVRETITDLCPEDLCPESGQQDFDERAGELADDLWPIAGNVLLPPEVAREVVPSVNDTFGDFGEQGDGEFVVAADAFRGRAELADEFLGGIGAEDATLHLLHINLPHGTWQYLPTGEEYRPGIVATPELTLVGGRWETDPELVRQFQQRHLLQLGFVDRYLQRVIATMKRAGIWRRSAMVVTADHGASFTPGDRRRSASETNIAEIAFVPTFIKRPGQARGDVSDERFCTTQIIEELIRALEIEPPPEDTGECPQDYVEVDNNAGELARVALGEADRQLRVTLRRNAELFGTGPIGRVYRWGARRGLIGQSVDAIGEGPGSEATAAVERPLRKGRRWVPAFIQGPVEGLEPGIPVAAAVDGTIVGVGPSFSFRDGERYSVMLPPESIRGEGHRLMLYAVEGELGEERLRQLLPGAVTVAGGAGP